MTDQLNKEILERRLPAMEVLPASAIATGVEPRVLEVAHPSAARPPASKWRGVAWRCVDVTIAVVAVFALSPIIAVVSLLVKASSPGPIIFRQRRVGRNGREFEILKFRTMKDGTHQQVLADPVLRAAYEENDFKLAENDLRITRIGRRLRKTSLDELPQLLNIIKGEMSLVGVRPLLPQELAQRPDYDRELYGRYRPGITGLWQVEGRSSVKAEERVSLDRQYLEQWSIRSNIVLLLRTPFAVLFGHGAH
jgi:lipopolysaccharide/colanic/teichoic acid biosynthesis glycosyltransferase